MTQTFTPSLDWGNEVFASALWVIKAWLIAVIPIVAVLAAIMRFTGWGRQFWAITGGYFTGRQSMTAWLQLGLLLLLVMVSVRLDVLISYYYNDQNSALQVAFEGHGAGNEAVKESGVRGFWLSIVVFLILVFIYVGRTVLDVYVMQMFIVRWRRWLTEQFFDDWLTDRAYYRARFIGERIDNPDQRIQQDIDTFTAGTGQGANNPNNGTSQTLLFGSVNSIVSVLSFGPILWHLSGSLTLFGLTIPKALFWLVLVYVVAGTAIAFWLGHPLIQLSFLNEKTNAMLRYNLVRLRDLGESIGFSRGERAEHRSLSGRLSDVITNYISYVKRYVLFFAWNQTVGLVINPLPLIVQAPRLFDQQLDLGDVTQSASAFTSVESSLSFFRNVYDSFASYRATIIRLHGLVEANQKARAMSSLDVVHSTDGSVQLNQVEVRTPSGEQLIDPLDMRLDPGEALMIVGRSGSGKSTLLRSLAQLWPFTTGTMHCPPDYPDTMFLPQIPYLPLGDLRAVVSYPADPIADDTRLAAVLDQVTLGHLAERLDDDEEEWAKALSPGEQQRIAFARVLLTRPRVVFLDEATSALDDGQEYALYRLLRTELPDTVVVSVSHRVAVGQHHTRQLELLGGGPWRLSDL